jgi:hypothetical protein
MTAKMAQLGRAVTWSEGRRAPTAPYVVLAAATSGAPREARAPTI